MASGNTPNPVPAPSFAFLQSSLLQAASSVGEAIVSQVTPDSVRQDAFQNAASIINGNGGSPPSSGVLALKFSAIATSYGLSTTEFASLVSGMEGPSLDLSTALSTLQAETSAATDASQLATALNNFETAIANVISEINALNLPIPVIAPPAISIIGINA